MATAPKPAAALAGHRGAPPPPIPPPPRGVAGNDGLLQANGHPYGDAITFTSTTPVPSDLVSILVIGTDARPEDNVLRSNADSLHLIVVNPGASSTTMLGI